MIPGLQLGDLCHCLVLRWHPCHAGFPYVVAVAAASSSWPDLGQHACLNPALSRGDEGLSAPVSPVGEPGVESARTRECSPKADGAMRKGRWCQQAAATDDLIPRNKPNYFIFSLSGILASKSQK